MEMCVLMYGSTSKESWWINILVLKENVVPHQCGSEMLTLKLGIKQDDKGQICTMSR